MVTDPISNMLVQIKNAQAIGREQVILPFSKMRFQVAEILKNSGYISNVEKKSKPVRPGKSEKGEHENLHLTLSYQDNQGALSGVRIISRPSRRMYIKAKDIKLVRSGHGLAIISTPQGIMDSREAKKNNLGGEIICEVW